MSFYDLFFLAAGGVIGSGWLFGAVQADQGTGSWAVLSWLIGGALMLVIVAVMVELSTVVPKTGGLTFLPLQSSGPLLATVVAAGVWVFYAVDPASEAVAMVRGLAAWSPGPAALVNGNGNGNGLTPRGIGWAALFLLGIAAVNLLGPRLFLIVNNVLTAFKILIPLLIVGLLLYTQLHPPAHAVHFPHSGTATTTRYGVGSVLSAVTASSVIYAYLGFQGPLDFAGNVRRRGVGEAARLRWAVYGTRLRIHPPLRLAAIRRHLHAASFRWGDQRDAIALRRLRQGGRAWLGGPAHQLAGQPRHGALPGWHWDGLHLRADP